MINKNQTYCEEAPMPKKRGMIECELSELEQSVASLGETLDTLIQSLESVSLVHVTDDKLDKEAEVELPTVGKRLRVIRIRVNAMNNSAHKQQDALEL